MHAVCKLPHSRRLLGTCHSRVVAPSKLLEEGAWGTLGSNTIAAALVTKSHTVVCHEQKALLMTHVCVSACLAVIDSDLLDWLRFFCGVAPSIQNQFVPDE
jgi:hypothetical protein